MANMLTTGISGIVASQVALNTVGNNITNADTVGYSRQTVVQTERISDTSLGYTIGGGVNVESVQRQYSAYLTNSVNASTSSLSRATTYNNLTTTLNGVLSGSGDVQGSLDTLYSAFTTVANAPSLSSARTSLLGNAASTATIFNTLGSQLAAQNTSVNKQISTTVDSINGITANIATLNKQITSASNLAGSPNSLLDQRDALVNSLSGLVGVNAVTEKDGTVSVYSSAGQTLVTGNNSYNMSKSSDVYDPTQTSVLDSAGNDVTNKISGGSLGALLDYRSNVLEPAQNALGQAAIALSTSVNAQQAQGLDQNGNLGGAIFSTASPVVLASRNNVGTGSPTVAITNLAATTASDYVLSYGAGGWTMKTTGGTPVPLSANADGSFSADGLTINVPAGATVGDSYEIEPTRAASTSLGVAMTDPAGIAAAAALTATPATTNKGTATVGAISLTDGTNANALTGASIAFTSATAYAVTDATGAVTTGTYTAGQPITVNGWSVTVSGTPTAGDTIAVAKNSNGLLDNSNALKMAALSDNGVLASGKVSVIDAYANLTTQIGNAGSQATTNLTTQTSLNAQAVSSQQSVSGVNLDEEAASLVKYQQSYQASAQIISAAQTIFSSLLAAVGT